MVSLPRPTSRSAQILAADGNSLGATVFEPRRPRATLVIHGATATRQTYYARFAEHAAARGWRVVTYDYRGIGASAPPSLRGYRATMTEWAELDARAAHRWAADLGDDVSMIGHSFGGQLVGLVDDLREVRAAVMVGSQLGSYRLWPWRQAARHALGWYLLIPAITRARGYLPGSAGLGVDLPAGVAREWARWCRDPDYFCGARPDAVARFARWDRPTMVLSSPDDSFAPPAAVDAYVARLRGARLELRRRPGLDHFDFFRPEALAIWREILDFVATPVFTPELTLEELEADLRYGRE